ncbi:MAG: rRNA maturation RNase YbeY [bacterium]|nr:rRNA maturation RNase YbeY [bacterium]
MKDTRRKRKVVFSLKNCQRKIRINCPQIMTTLKKNNLFFSTPPSYINVVIVSDNKIKKLNKEFLHKNTTTDVLSFKVSYQEGEVIISAETAQQNALQYGFPVEYEIIYLIIHGYLHLRNYTDYTEKERTKMLKIQDRIFTKIIRNRKYESEQ